MVCTLASNALPYCLLALSNTLPHCLSPLADHFLQDTAAGEAVSTAVGTYAHAFAAAVQALLPAAPQQEQQPQQQQMQQNGHSSSAQAQALAGSGLSELLLMCHHPAITVGVAKRLSTWHTACRRVKGIPEALKGERVHKLG
jgi:hypothetical protein